MDKNAFTLVVLAAGLGTRFGGLKQLSAITDQNFSILDFSIYDAIHNGANQIVFIIRKEIEVDFKQKYPESILGVPVRYVFQDVNDVPSAYKNIERTKPWGTAHALLALKPLDIKTPLLIINADDFYGKDAFVKAQTLVSDISENTYGMVAYKVANTLSDFGSVSRGECIVTNSVLTKVIERTNIERINGQIVYKENNESSVLSENELVSMNFWVLDPSILKHIETQFLTFLSHFDPKTKAEFFLPSVINELIVNDSVAVKVLSSEDKWLGITYSEDLQHVKNEVAELTKQSIYPTKLW